MNRVLDVQQPYRFPMVLLCLLLMCVSIWAQTRPPQNVPQLRDLTRGKMWIKGGENGNLGNSSTPAYPGYYGNTNNIIRLQSEVMIYAKTPTQTYLDYDVLIGGSWADVPTVLVKNYNFPTNKGAGYGPDYPEEYFYGTSHSYDTNPTDTNIPLFWKVSTRRMVWSLPKYDDFVITKITLTNNGTEPWTDVYYGWHHSIQPCRAGDKYTNDVEYTWAKDLKTYGDEQGAFIFYDDTAWPNFSDTPAKYLISPGNTTGDRGDPGNILEVNSLNMKLLSPQVFAEGFLDCTPNKEGKKKFWYNIRNSEFQQPWSHSAAPAHEVVNWHQGNYDSYLAILRDDQPRMSWREARAKNHPTAGNSWERTPLVTLGVGPYDLAPNDSITILMLHCGGDWRRDITVRGGLQATQALPDSSIAELKKNWAAAIELIENGFKPKAYPPPTCGNPPRQGLGDELEVKTFSRLLADGSPSQGHEIAWIPVPDDYMDPIRKINDFAGYRIYKSEMAMEGPWEKVAEISKDQAKSLISGGRVRYSLESAPGIPARFGVTSFDTEGLESGMTAYSLDPLAAPRAPSNDLSKVRVVPSPFRQSSMLTDAGEEKRLSFENIPAQCTIRIYTLAGELVQTVKHNGFGSEAWGSSTGDANNYMLTRFSANVMPGVYLYHIESHVAGHEGETATGKFAIIK